jgi:NAD-dependent deacetylase
MDAVSRLAELLLERQPCVALTGAGISTESGIPDFRSRSGVWADVDPLEVASLSAFRESPERVWELYRWRLRILTEAEPNRAHRALAELERRGLVEAVVTQNVDMLHTRAGSREVIEVHGSIRTSSCGGCGAVCPLAEVLELLERDEGAPRCSACATILKPDVVFFEEMLPGGAIDRAYALARSAGLLLVIGSSLEVYPVAELPAVAKAAGATVAIVNLGETASDRLAEVKLDAGAGETLDALLAAA